MVMFVGGIPNVEISIRLARYIKMLSGGFENDKYKKKTDRTIYYERVKYFITRTGISDGIFLFCYNSVPPHI